MSVRTPVAREKKRSGRWGTVAKVVLLSVVAFVVNLPILTIILNSLQTNDALMISSSIIPAHITFSNYSNLLEQTDFPSFFKNSMIVGGVSTVIAVIVAGFAGYALSRFRMRAMNVYGSGILLLQMFPIILGILPLFLILKTLMLTGTYWAAVVIYISVQVPFATWLFRGFFASIPVDLEEAAWIDGCSRLGGVFRVVLRVSTPGLVAVGILSFLFAWNDYLIANIFLNQQDLMTVPVGIQMFTQQYASEWATIMAASTMAMVPVLIVFMFVQRYMVQGMTAGAVKG